jgi:hypothetical protein
MSKGADVARLVYWTMVQRAISTAAMDDLEGKREAKRRERVDQFMRPREVIEEQASRKFDDRSESTEG